ncbi:ACT domain-containing protein [Terrilactibacillus sp. BCM23-1]|uniref:UPF0735 ACT domain-containing protein GMB86_10430 n=1 Tax=Terrilactibacillus tamarindi TaxID=2599694 RepID=A0A6N8CQJ9_9BACI|nr:ACT domain-containing protein [Terrilactibacillus tamarindi]MTT32422.1 ACT domain-containing protein [Terrilactibacillus tamarindi]
MKEKQQFYLVREDVLSESMQKVLQVKQLIERKQAENVTEAVKMVGLSRSAYYKYRDGIFPFHQIMKENIVTLLIHLEDQKGSLTQLLEVVAKAGCNILTIHQTIPLQGSANVTLSLDTSAVVWNFNQFIEELKNLDSVDQVNIIGTGGYNK